MTFDEWKEKLLVELQGSLKLRPIEAGDYVAATGDEPWREAFDDGLSPRDAAYEEAYAAQWLAY